MKHYRICIQAERHGFDYLCSTISEAYGAVDMDRGTLIETDRHPIRIRVEDGEV